MIKDNTIEEIILRKKPIHVFFQIFSRDEINMQLKIARKTGITYSHVSNHINKFEGNGLVAKELQGRVKMLTLTKKGLEIGTHLKEVHRILTELDNGRKHKNG